MPSQPLEKSHAMPGQIFRHPRYYQDNSGWQTKYLLVLAVTADDLVVRLLTSRAHGRPEQPPCYHGDPYPERTGVLGDTLGAKTWLDLRQQDDYDRRIFIARVAEGLLTLETTLPMAQLCAALDCAANADDTIRQQSRLMRDERARIGCD